jgi:CheY-like chemotaxis protein
MLNVLIVDDEECIRDSLKIHLTHLGYKVETAEHPLECICVQNSACQEESPFADVIITDQCMPHMTGLDFIASRVERGCKGAEQHLAIMSANLTDDDLLRAADLGCTIFTKPFSLVEIETWLEEIVAHRQISSGRQ